MFLVWFPVFFGFLRKRKANGVLGLLGWFVTYLENAPSVPVFSLFFRSDLSVNGELSKGLKSQIHGIPFFDHDFFLDPFIMDVYLVVLNQTIDSSCFPSRKNDHSYQT